MTLAYLATPYNHEKRQVMEDRKLAALDAAGRLLAAGQRVFSPIAHNVAIIETTGLEAGWGVWSEFDKDMLSRCDLLIVLKLLGWEESLGVQAEIAEARRLGIPIQELAPEDLPPSRRPSRSSVEGRDNDTRSAH